MQYESRCNNEPQINLTIIIDIVIHLVGSIMEKKMYTIFVALTFYYFIGLFHKI